VRAALQHNLVANNALARLWYSGAMFRYERPQAGRQRQFHQYGAELLGSAHPSADVEIISLVYDLLRRIGFTELELEINTLGNSSSRDAYRSALVEYLSTYCYELSSDSQIRLEKNPLRILDSKDANDKAIIANAPAFEDFLDDESQAHFQQVKHALQELHIPFSLNNRLVRGLDYYSHTVFEFVTTKLGAQSTVAAGGRYDALFTQLGAKKPVPAVGFALGMERLLMLMESENITPPPSQGVHVYCLGFDDATRTKLVSIAAELRRHGIATATDIQDKSFKAQMKEANKLQAAYTILLGSDEMDRGEVTVKNMETSEQTTVSMESVVEFLQGKTKK
jgi:histidyl-tRNA synthetase